MMHGPLNAAMFHATRNTRRQVSAGSHTRERGWIKFRPHRINRHKSHYYMTIIAIKESIVPSKRENLIVNKTNRSRFQQGSDTCVSRFPVIDGPLLTAESICQYLCAAPKLGRTGAASFSSSNASSFPHAPLISCTQFIWVSLDHLVRRQTRQGTMWSEAIILFLKQLDFFFRILERKEPVDVQALIAKAAVE
jgi:hypothetical protein